jgi:hypothetical protein
VALVIADDYVVEPDLCDPHFFNSQTIVRPLVRAVGIEVGRQIIVAQ